VAFSPDDKLLASGSYDHTIRIWDVNKGENTLLLSGHTSYIGALRFSPDAKLLASSSDDCTVRLWDLRSGDQLLLVQAEAVDDISFSNDGSYLHTNREPIRVPLVNQSPTDESLLPKVWSRRGIWLTCNDRNVLWLPREYRSEYCTLAVYRSLLAFGHASGRVVFLEPDPKFSFP